MKDGMQVEGDVNGGSVEMLKRCNMVKEGTQEECRLGRMCGAAEEMLVVRKDMWGSHID